ncbi:cell division protein ZipA [Salinisphaera sp. T5B8]|uniref:cell division protein ZipA C-terminal FtsZ-binding domain-containing protein n=1 Tax=Salinisphaera sp. T5B8 TaxID=1304154 RepID=UPI00333F2906
MSIVQWLLLILLIAVVGGAYWYMRRQAGNDPWQGMDDDAPTPGGERDDGADRGESLGGDSYIVGVRTLSKNTPASRRAAGKKDAPLDDGDYETIGEDGVEASWTAYKKRGAEPKPLPEEQAAADAPAAPSAAATPGASERVENMRAPSAPPGGEQEVFLLHVAAPAGRMFDGPDVHAALQSQDLKFGLNDQFHRVTETHGIPESVFAVANMLKPGTLDPVDQDHLHTPGLVLYTVVPGPIEGGVALRDMMETANGLAQALGGEVLDDKRALLKAQTAQYMLDQVADLDRRAKIAKRR